MFWQMLSLFVPGRFWIHMYRYTMYSKDSSEKNEGGHARHVTKMEKRRIAKR